MPTFERKESNSWPPGTATKVAVLYLHNDGSGDGELNLDTPAAETPNTISQDYTAGSYNMGTAVAESPRFGTMNLSTVSVTYISPPLAQDVILVGPPTVELHADSDGYPLQVNVRIRELLDNEENVSHFITRANACAWTGAQDDGWFTGEEFGGETRVHEFKAGNKIVVEVTTVDNDEYNPTRSRFFMTPYLGDMSIDIYHHTNGQVISPTNVTLPLLWDNPNGDLFDEGGLLAEGGDSNAPSAAEHQPEPVATLAAPEPLAIAAQLLTDFTNPGGWRNYAPKVLIECSGGVGAVTCPADTILTTDGVNQSFTFTATDSVGTVVTDTVDNVTIDNTAPAVTTTLPETQTFCSGSTTQLDFSVSDVLSGLDESTATFNGLPAEDNDVVSLVAGANTLSIYARDEAGNRITAEEILQVNYNLTTEFPPDGEPVNPLLPLTFEFKVNDACSPQGWFDDATGTLWLTGPDGEEIPAEWYGLPTGNTFAYDGLTGWYSFDADLTGLASGTWTARVHLDDGNDHTTTFVIPNGQVGAGLVPAPADIAGPPASCDAAGWLPRLLDLRRCR